MKNNNEKILNGYMANNMEELIYLGKQMEDLRDGKQLEEDGRNPDPQQFDEE
ncbi:multidrug ABC transporter ATPase [Lysinibacillus sp. LZ02]|uniref:multidrug ABC transporter ATPase n=1 Tax=Lysinibacillus sp. LZ02 TaxID=3420668 RepID=UPI003D36FB90